MKILKISIVFGLIISILLCMARFDALCCDLRENVFRLHIRAASDSDFDQELKLKVRDSILNTFGKNFLDFQNKNSAVEYAKNNLESITNVAKQTVVNNGYAYDVKVYIGESFFENREYDTFTLPAGTYEAINIIIDKGEGKNWWCVMFPAICIGASSRLQDNVNQASANVAENSDDFEIRFKTVEIYEDLKNFFKNRKNK